MNISEQVASRQHDGLSSRFDALVTAIGRADLERGCYDPCCRTGELLLAARRHEFPAVGSDIVDHQPKVGSFKFAVRDFLDRRTMLDRWPAIVMRPPSQSMQRFVVKALLEVKNGGVVAVLTPLSRLATTPTRRELFHNSGSSG
jgi:hypothetical protein